MPAGDLLGPDFQPRDMEATFEFDTEDLVAFNLHLLQHSTTFRRGYRKALMLLTLLGCLAVLFAVWMLSLAGGRLADSMFLLWVPLLVIGLTIAAFPWLRRRAIRQQLQRAMAEGKNVGVYGQHRLSITPEGVREDVSAGYSFRRWTAVEKIALTQDHAFLYISALSAYVLPKRAFGDELHFQQFVRSAQIWMQRAQQEVQQPTALLR
jgi:hypothetical protein